MEISDKHCVVPNINAMIGDKLIGLVINNYPCFD